MIFVGCCLQGELWQDETNIYLKPYLNTDLDHLAWAGEEIGSHRETGELAFLSIIKHKKRIS